MLNASCLVLAVQYLGGRSPALIAAAGSGPAATNFLSRGSTLRFKPSRLLAPNSSKSPFSANTISSIVKNLSTRMIAKPTQQAARWPLANTNVTSFFSLSIPRRSRVLAEIQEYSLPGSTKSLGITADRVRSTEFSILQRVWNVPIL